VSRADLIRARFRAISPVASSPIRTDRPVGQYRVDHPLEPKIVGKAGLARTGRIKALTQGDLLQNNKRAPWLAYLDWDEPPRLAAKRVKRISPLTVISQKLRQGSFAWRDEHLQTDMSEVARWSPREFHSKAGNSIR
jgi:hypothetical protein